MRVDRTIEPGRYALHPDGGWQIFTDRAELDFKPVAVVTVKPRDSVALDPMAELAAFGETVGAPAPIAKPPFKLGITNAPGSAKRRPIELRRPVPVTAERAREIAAQARRDVVEPRRTATPGDVFRAIADEFGILPAVGASTSCARFKPLMARDDDADAARAYERAIEERQGRE